MTAPVFDDSPEKTRAAAALHSLLRIVAATTLTVGALTALLPEIMTRPAAAEFMLLGILGISCVSLVLLRAGRVTGASRVFLWGMWASVTIHVLLSATVTGNAPTNYLAVAVTAGWLLGARAATWAAAGGVAVTLVVAVLETSGMIWRPYFSPYAPSAWIVLVMGIVLTMRPLIDVLRHLRETLHLARERMAELERTSRELRRERDLFTQVWEHSGDGMRLTDADGTLLRVNEAYLRLVDKRREDLVGELLPIVYADGQRDKTLREHRQRFASRSFEFRIDREVDTWDGRRVALEFTNSMIALPDGSPALFSVVRDVTENKRAERALRDALSRFESMVENTPSVGIQGFERDGTIRHWNAASTALYGHSAEEALGHRIQNLMLDEKARIEFEREIAKMWDSGRASEAREWEVRTADGTTRHIYSSVSPVLKDGVVVEAFRMDVDVTRMRTLESQLAQAQRLESIGRLAGGVAHDFNNLLTIINGYCDLALTSTDIPAAAQTYFHEVRKAGERATDLTRQLLAFSRKQVLQPKVLDLNAVVRDSEKMLRRMIGEDIELVCRLPERLWHIVADPGQMHQVIMNLAVNARDAMPDGGTLTIETSNVVLDRAHASTHANARAGKHVMLAIADTGHGMDAATLENVFEPFFTTKEPGKGTGLGLAMVHGIVTQSGGHITVRSEPGHGTEFRFYFPCHEGDAEDAQATVEERSRGGTETILVVEDQDDVRRFVAESLRALGYHVLEAADGEQALALCAEHQGVMHLLLSDVVIPRIRGPELAARVRALRPDIRILYMSGYTDAMPRYPDAASGGARLLQKPFGPAALDEAVREALG